MKPEPRGVAAARPGRIPSLNVFAVDVTLSPRRTERQWDLTLRGKRCSLVSMYVALMS